LPKFLQLALENLSRGRGGMLTLVEADSGEVAARQISLEILGSGSPSAYIELS
jgi:hypothetical protein